MPYRSAVEESTASLAAALRRANPGLMTPVRPSVTVADPTVGTRSLASLEARAREANLRVFGEANPYRGVGFGTGGVPSATDLTGSVVRNLRAGGEGATAAAKAGGIGAVGLLMRVLQLIDIPGGAVRGVLQGWAEGGADDALYEAMDNVAKNWRGATNLKGLGTVAGIVPEEMAGSFSEGRKGAGVAGGITADILTDPTTYLFGVGAIKKALALSAAKVVRTAATHGVKEAARQVGEHVARKQGPAVAARVAAKFEGALDENVARMVQRGKNPGEVFNEVADHLADLGSRGFTRRSMTDLSEDARELIGDIPGAFTPGIRAKVPLLPGAVRRATPFSTEATLTRGGLQPMGLAGKAALAAPGTEAMKEALGKGFDYWHDVRGKLGSEEKFQVFRGAHSRAEARRNGIIRELQPDIEVIARSGANVADLEDVLRAPGGGLGAVAERWGKEVAESYERLFHGLLEAARSAGMKIGQVDGYVTRVVTDPDIKAALREYGERGAKGRDTFGTPFALKRRHDNISVREFNDWMQGKRGTNFFEDNPQIAFTIYLRSMAGAISRHEFANELLEAGIAKDLVKYIVKRINNPRFREGADVAAEMTGTLRRNLGRTSIRLEEKRQVRDLLRGAIPPLREEGRVVEKGLRFATSRRGPELVDTSKIPYQAIEAERGTYDKLRTVAEVREFERARSPLTKYARELNKYVDYPEEVQKKIGEIQGRVDEVRREIEELLRRRGNLKSNLRGAERLARAAGQEQYFEKTVRFLDELPEGMKRYAGLRKGEVAVPQPVDDFFKNVVDAVSPSNPFWDFYDKVSHLFRLEAILHPGFVLRNAMGIIWQNHVLLGADSKYAVKALKLLKGSASGGKRGLQRIKNIDSLPPILRDAIRDGVVDADVIHGITVGTTGKAVDKFFASQRAVENWGRLTAYMYAREGLGLSRDAAIDTVGFHHFFSTHLTPAERKWAKRLPAFYTWAKNNLRLQASYLVNKPGAFTGYGHIQRGSQERAGETPASLGASRFTTSALPIMLGEGKMFSPDLPFTSLSEISENPILHPLKSLGLSNKTMPHARILIQAALGRSGITTPSPGTAVLAPNWARAIAPVLKAWNLYIDTPEGPKMAPATIRAFHSLQPFLGKWDAMNPRDREAELKKTRRMWSTFAGVALRTVTPAEKEAELKRRKALLDASSRKLEMQRGMSPP